MSNSSSNFPGEFNLQHISKTIHLLLKVLAGCFINSIIIASALLSPAQLLFSLGDDSTDVSKDIAIDSQGNIILVGYFFGSVDFDPGAEMKALTSNGSSDMFVAKYDSLGSYVWAFSAGSEGHDATNCIVVTAEDAIYIAGSFSGTIDLDPSKYTHGATSNGNRDIFIAKYDKDGNYKGGFGMGGGADDEAIDIALDTYENIHVTGYFTGSMDANPAPETHIITGSANTTDVFVAAYGLNYVYRWAFGIGGAVEDHGAAIKVASDGNIYVAGFFGGSVNFDPQKGERETEALNAIDVFLVKYNLQGKFLSLFKGRGYGTDEVKPGAIALDKQDNVYIAGYKTALFESGTISPPCSSLSHQALEDGFIIGFTRRASCNWAYNLGWVRDDAVNGVAVDQNGNVFLTGYFSGDVDFDPHSFYEYHLPSLGKDFASDAFIVKYLPNRLLGWANGVGGNVSGGYYRYEGIALAVDEAGNLLVTGKFYDIGHFYTARETKQLTSRGSCDIFLVKYTPNGDFWNSPLKIAAKRNAADCNLTVLFSIKTCNLKITFTLPETDITKLLIFDNKGCLIRTLINEKLEAGTHNLSWDGIDNLGKLVSSGLYFFNLTTSQSNQSKRFAFVNN